MSDIIKKLSEPLSIHDIELRIGTCTAKGFSLLLYKTARVDAKRLNDVCGLGWKNSYHYDDKGILYCVIALYDAEHGQWVDRGDVGTESNTEKEKGSYSDAFKRAGFKCGIGPELYTAPFVWITWNMEKDEYRSNGNKTVWKPKNFFSSNLRISEYEVNDGRIAALSIRYDKDEVFSMNNGKKKPPPSKATAEDKKAAWEQFKGVCENMGVEAMDFIESQVDSSDKSAVYGVVRKWLANEQALRDQLVIYKNM
jgi:hypothetical protein